MTHSASVQLSSLTHDRDRTTWSAHLLKAVGAIIVLAASAGRAHAGVTYNPPTSTVKTDFSINNPGAGLGPLFPAASTTTGQWFGSAWINPNFIFLGPLVFEPGAAGTHGGAPVGGNWVSYGTATTHTPFAFYTWGAGGLVLNAGVRVNAPITSFMRSLDPGNLIGMAELKTTFQSDLPATVGGFNLCALPATWSLNHNVPAGSYFNFRGEIHYDRINTATGAVIGEILVPGVLPQILDSGALAGVGVWSQTVAGLINPAAPIFIAQGQTLRVRGTIRWRGNHNGGGVGGVAAGPAMLDVTFTPSQSSVTPIPVSTCQGDFNQDGHVNGTDLAILLGAWGPCGSCAADLDGNHVVNGVDLGLLLGKWGNCQGYTMAGLP